MKKDSLIDQIQQLKSEEKLALEGYHTTKRKLEEYWNDRPLFEKNQQLKQKLEEANQKGDIYKTELEQVRFWERKKENTFTRKCAVICFDYNVIMWPTCLAGQVDLCDDWQPNLLKPNILDVRALTS